MRTDKAYLGLAAILAASAFALATLAPAFAEETEPAATVETPTEAAPPVADPSTNSGEAPAQAPQGEATKEKKE